MDLMTLVAKLTLDAKDYENGLGKAQESATGFGSKMKSALGGVTKGVVAVGAAASAAATAVGGIAMKAVQGYGDAEQLVGGIETLFGKQNLGKVLDNANKAYKTAGLSANQYMETTIQSAAAMISSLDGDQAKAADKMDMSITDMADNVNKMGTTMESVQNAYRGFSRGNFTMLDNLALGYAGTKKGMQELLQKAEEIEKQQGRNTKYSIDSYADIVDAIHVVQTEMGITGTTAKEAEGTITGSLASLKTAWDNLINGLASPDADLGQLIQNVVDSAKIALKNLKPAFLQALKGIAQLVREIAPIIEEELPGLVDEILPPLIEAAMTLIRSIVNSLPNIIKILADALPDALKQLIPALVSVLPMVLSVIAESIPSIIKAIIVSIKESWPLLVNALQVGFAELTSTTSGKILSAVGALWAGIKAYKIVTSITGAVSTIAGLISGAGGLIPLITGMLNPIGLVVAAVAAAAVFMITNWETVMAAWGTAVEFFKGIGAGIQNAFKNVRQWTSEKFLKAKQEITRAWDNIGAKFATYRDKIIGVFTGLPARFKEVGQNIMNGLGQGISDKLNWIKEKVKGLGNLLPGWLQKALGINSPSKVFRKLGQYTMEGYELGLYDAIPDVNKAMDSLNAQVKANTPEVNASAIGGTQGQTFTVPRTQQARDLTVILELDRMQLGRAVYRLNNDETQRVGVRLAGGYA